MTITSPTRLSWLAVGLIAASLGCSGSELNLAEVDGVVTLDGKPVADAGVMFTPADPKLGPPGTGVTDAEGKFSLKTINQDGAIVGDHRVTVSKVQEQLLPVPGSRALKHVVKRDVPEKYEHADTSELKATVAEDDNHVNLTLSSK